jgi:hypothetical protein
MPYVIGALISVAVIALYIVSYSANQKTDAPDGCEIPEGTGCSTCGSSGACGVRPKKETHVK